MRPREILRCSALLGAGAHDGAEASHDGKHTRVAVHFPPPFVLILCFNFSAYSG
jgi:hypothetical protein